MRKIQVLAMLSLLASGGVAVAGPDASKPQDAQFTGDYYGQIMSGGALMKAVTSLHLSANANLEGDYSFEDIDGSTAHGTLQQCGRTGLHLTCEWHDKYGVGALRMKFDPSLTSFRGQWTTGRRPVRWLEWNGSKGMS